MSKLDTKNSLVESNGSFSESVSTTFVDDCRYTKAFKSIQALQDLKSLTKKRKLE